MRIALVTCKVLPEPDPDEAPLLAACAAAGHDAASVPWDDDGADFAAFDVALLRATWDYHHRPAAFRAWIDRTAQVTRLCNPAPVVHWNLDKVYLRDLAAAGVPIVPTEFVARAGSVAQIAAARGWRDVVVKPTISAGSANTRRFDAAQHAAADAFLADQLAQRAMMVQPYLAAIDRFGETNLVCIDGEVTHAVRKAARFAGGHESVAACAPDPRERAFALRVLAAAPKGVLYARVDVMYGDDGELLLSELELIEPSLHFRHGPGSAARLVAAL